MKTIELAQVQQDFPGVCQSVARTGQAIIVTQECEPLVSIGPTPRVVSGGEDTIWERRRQFEEGHGPLTEDFDLPPRHLDAIRWEDPFKD